MNSKLALVKLSSIEEGAPVINNERIAIFFSLTVGNVEANYWWWSSTALLSFNLMEVGIKYLEDTVISMQRQWIQEP